MRLSCKVAAALLCLGSLLLLYLLAGSAAAPPRPPPASSAPARPAAPGARRQPRLSRSPPRRSPPGGRPASASLCALTCKFGLSWIDCTNMLKAQRPQTYLTKKEDDANIPSGFEWFSPFSLSGRRRQKCKQLCQQLQSVLCNCVKPGEQKGSKEPLPSPCMHLAVVACGDRLEETLIMLKSALLFSNRRLCFHIFAEDSLKPEFEKKLKEWPSSYTKKFEHNIYPITFSVGNAQEWKKLFKPCAAQRLFLPVILKDVDSLLYVDTDVLFLRPIDDIWHILKEFNSTQLAAMAPEHEIPKIGWYSRFARHPYYGTTGVNSGVMLMNLTRIRNTHFKNSMIPSGLTWEEMLYPLYQKYKNYITWGDQDLLNIIFYFNPECLYVFPCQWNYRPDHCMYGSNCKGAEEEGVSILHGNRGVYHDDKQPTFKALYEVIRDFPFEDNLFQSLYYPLQSKFLDTVHTLCGRIPQVFLKQIEKTMKKVYENRVIVYLGANHRY